MKTSEKFEMLAAAMSKAQRDMKPASKDSVNPHFKSRYADLASVWDACRQPLTSNGLSIWQDVENHGQAVSITTRIVHESGQWAEFGPLAVPVEKENAHGVASATTYGKRITLCAAVGIVADEDDDGNGAVDFDRPTGQRVDAQDRPVSNKAGLPPCPKCKTNKDVIVSKFGPGFYCLKSKTKFDPVSDQAATDPQVEQYAEAFE
jgi:hypothetical protein